MGSEKFHQLTYIFMAQIIIVNYDLNWWKGLFLGTVVFTTFSIVKEIPPISGDFYDTIFLKKNSHL